MRKDDETSKREGANADALTSARRLRLIQQDEGSAPAIDENDGDYNIKILRPMFGYLRNKLGADVLADIVHDCGLPVDTVERSTGWISHERFEHFLAAVRELVGSDEEFMRACVFEIKKQYGAFLLVMRTMSVRSSYELLAKTGHMVCRVGSFSTRAGGRTSINMLYETQRSESRLNCLSRQAQLTSLPTLFLGMAPAKLKEHSCVAHGDDRCQYELSWYEPLRLRWVGAGMAIGAAAALALPETATLPGLTVAVLAALGGTTGVAWELARLLGEQRRFSDATTMEMENVIVAHAQATDDLNALRERERDWNRQIEERVAARTRKLNEVVERLQAVLRHRSGQFPVATKSTEPDAPVQRSVANQSGRLASMETAVDSVSRLVGELVNIASDDATKREIKPEDVSVDGLVAQIRRQLKALMIGRNIRVTVFQTREAPATVRTARPILDRVLDNLLFNASRHTDHGTVVVEAGGTPGSLLLKISDTGSGLSKERLEEVFGTTQGSSQAPSHDRSSLAYAAKLLDQIGGRLEIMSEPGVGTTVWMYLPINALEGDASSSQNNGSIAANGGDPEAEQSVVGRVVRIRSKLQPAAKDPSP
jgi:signal transduction histidine kinase